SFLIFLHFYNSKQCFLAASTPQLTSGSASQFHDSYIRLRAACVTAAQQTHFACACLRTCPPPAIAAGAAPSSYSAGGAGASGSMKDDQTKYIKRKFLICSFFLFESKLLLYF